ncbi:MAG: hypothetical protein JXR95_08635 [Deltaproteobacteria bacterium]|nr:hypothetical protein [Deltaproteobacteria bacterium]
MKKAVLLICLILSICLTPGCDGESTTGSNNTINNVTNNATNNLSDGSENLVVESTYNSTLKTVAVMNAFITDSSKKSSIDDIILDINLTGSENVELIIGAITSSVNDTCLSIDTSLDELTFTADFSENCPIDEAGISVEGSVSVSVAIDQGIITVEFVFTDFSVENLPVVNGNASIAWDGNGNYEIDLALSVGEADISFTGTVVFDTGVFLLNGSASYKKGVVEYDLSISDLAWNIDDCYPSGGEVVLENGILDKTVVFDSSTPSTGEATLTVRNSSETLNLPAYGSCPP